MNRTLLLSSAAVLALVSHTASAQDLIELEGITISANIAPQDINRTGAIVDILDDEDLGNSPLSIADSLDRIPGTSYSSNGGLGAATTMRVRGLDGKYIGVRIDGIDVTDPSGTQTQFNFGGLTGIGFGRTELVKGSQSARYGSEAVGGVIDISTRRGTEDGVTADLSAEIGSFNTKSAAISLAMREGETGLTFNLSQVKTDGFSARAGDDEDDGFDQTFITVTGDTIVGDGIELGFSALYRTNDLEIDRFSFDNSGEISSDEKGARVYAGFDAFGIDHEISYSTFQSERRDPLGFTSEFDGDRDQFSYLGSTDLAFGTVSFGLDSTEESFRTTTDSGDTTTNSLLGEVILRPTDTVDVALSLRYDDNDTFGGNTSGRIALAWQVQPDTTLRAVAGTGFRAPSLFEQFSLFGDPGLGVEESRSFELGVEHRYDNGSFVEATLFRTEIDDLIQFDGASTACASGFGCYNQLPGTTVSQGFELGGQYALSTRATFFGTYTYTDAKTDDTRLARVPRHDLTLGVEGDITDRLSGRLDVKHVADVEPSAFAPVDNKVGDYTTVGLGLNYAINDMATAYLRVENLFDEDYETSGGFNTAPMSVFVGLRARF